MNVLELKDGRYYENGRRLNKQDYIEHFNHHDGYMVISCITNQLYRIRGDLRRRLIQCEDSH